MAPKNTQGQLTPLPLPMMRNRCRILLYLTSLSCFLSSVSVDLRQVAHGSCHGTVSPCWHSAMCEVVSCMQIPCGVNRVVLRLCHPFGGALSFILLASFYKSGVEPLNGDHLSSLLNLCRERASVIERESHHVSRLPYQGAGNKLCLCSLFLPFGEYVSSSSTTV